MKRFLLTLLAALALPNVVNASVNESLKEELNYQLSKAACEHYSKNKEIYPGEYRQIANEIYIKSEKFRSKYLPLRNKKAIDYFDSYYPLSGKHSDQYLLSLFENSCKKDSFAIFERLLDPSENYKVATNLDTEIKEKKDSSSKDDPLTWSIDKVHSDINKICKKAKNESQMGCIIKMHYKLGQQLYKQLNYRQASENFNKVLELLEEEPTPPEILKLEPFREMVFMDRTMALVGMGYEKRKQFCPDLKKMITILESDNNPNNSSILKTLNSGYVESCQYLILKDKKQNESLKKGKNLTNDDSKHKKCLSASDYEGCMKYQTSSSPTTKKFKLKPKDCFKKWCNPFEIDPDEKDNLGLKLIPGFWFIDNPVSRISTYISEPYKLKVNGNYGRYIHVSEIMRYYSEGSSGTSGYSTTIGGSYTNCTGSGSSFTCSTSPSTTINTPGKSGTAPGIKQRNKEVVIDCEEGTIAEHINDKLIKTEGMNGKKRKWLTLDNYGKGSIPSMYAGHYCEKNNYETLPSSSFSKYANKRIKK